MVNQIILDYLRKYSGSYKLEDLKRKIISSGYSEDDVEEAANLLGLGEVEKSTSAKYSGDKYSKLLKIAAICGILVFVFAILAVFLQSSFFQGATGIFSFNAVFSLLSSVSMIFFYYGFVVLGKKYDKKLIRVVSRVFIIFVILLFVLQILSVLFFNDINSAVASNITRAVGANSQNYNIGNIIAAVLGTLLIYFVIALILILVMVVLGILFGAGVFKLREDVKLAKAAGILYIIGYIGLIIGVGVLLLLVAHVLAIVMMFKASKS